MVVSVPEVFSYWLQGGRIDVGFLSAAQIDRYGNLCQHRDRLLRAPRCRPSGAGGAEIASSAEEIIVCCVRIRGPSSVRSIS